MEDNTSAKDFTANVHTSFQVKLANAPRVDLELVEVKMKISEPNEQSGLERFSLFFRGPSDPFLPQGTYEFVHDRLGMFQIFLVPIGREEQGFQYEAVFNRFLTL